MKRAFLLAGVLYVLSEIMTPQARATSYTYTSADGNYQAVLTPGAGTVSVSLTDLLQSNSTTTLSDGNLISKFSFIVSGENGTSSSLTSAMGALSTVYNSHNADVNNPAGSYTNHADTQSDISGVWKVSGSTTISLTSSSSPPTDLIIGPDSAGGFTGAGTYKTDSSVAQHEPVVLGTATFVISAPGVTASSTFSSVTVFLGTEYETTVQTTLTATSPEPASITIVGITGLVMAGYGWRRRKRTTA